jgi:hypothetical protein
VLSDQAQQCGHGLPAPHGDAASGLEAVKRENGHTTYQVGPGRFEFFAYRRFAALLA